MQNQQRIHVAKMPTPVKGGEPDVGNLVIVKAIYGTWGDTSSDLNYNQGYYISERRVEYHQVKSRHSRQASKKRIGCN